MRVEDLLRLVVRNLSRVRVRTGLTTLGVVIGVAAIVTLLSISMGFQENITSELEGIGDITEITVIGDIGGFGMGEQEPKIIDEDAIEEIEEIDGVQAVVPSLSVSGTIEVGRYLTSTSITAIDPEKGEDLQIEAASGRFLRRKDTDVMVVGYKTSDVFRDKKTLKKIEGLDLLGKNAQIVVKRRNLEGEEETKSFRVKIVGIIEEQGTQADYNVYVPLALAADIKEWQTMQPNIIKRQGYESLVVKAENADNVNEITDKIIKMGYLAFSFKQIIESINSIFTILEIVLLGIGAIALIVAALGIINIMLMSILERTREIGIMKVVGASNTDITRIFLMEALTIGFMGGVGGVIMGVLVANAIDVIARVYVGQQGGPVQSIVVMPLWLIFFAVGFAMMVGLVAGVYPARKAAQLSPVEALRHQ